MNPTYPIYIPSKGRSDRQLTSKALTRMGVPHFTIVEEQERKAYEAHRSPLQTLITLDPEYRNRHVTFDDYGHSRSFGAGPARNMAWDHAIASGAKRHWDIDDNIRGFFRLNWNLKTPVSDGTVFAVMEQFADRYTNVAIAGPQYFMFAPRHVKLPPLVANTRIYSCSLILNEIPFRWRLRMNEDTDLSLQALKAGWATVQFNAFLQDKVTTQTMKGGYNSAGLYADKQPLDHEPLYHTHCPGKSHAHTGCNPIGCMSNPHEPCLIFEGWCCDEHLSRSTMWKSQMLVDQHPDVARIAWRFGRWHHYVDYSPFADNKLILKPGIEIGPETNNYGMILEQYRPDDGSWTTIRTPWEGEPTERGYQRNAGWQ
jgi:hypothetical protein